MVHSKLASGFRPSRLSIDMDVPVTLNKLENRGKCLFFMGKKP